MAMVSKTQRARKANSKYIKDNIRDIPESAYERSVTVVCNQTRKSLTTKVASLTKEDGVLSLEDLEVPGTQLILTEKGKGYPVTLMVDPKTKEKMMKPPPKKRALDLSSDSEVEDQILPSPRSQRPRLDDFSEILQAKEQLTSTPIVVAKDSTTSSHNNEFETQVLKRLARIEKMLRKLVSGDQLNDSSPTKLVAMVKEETDSHFIFNGMNLLKVPAKDAIAYGRSLLDILFTKSEQKQSLLYSSKKSLKPALSKEKVDLLIDCVAKKYPDYDWTKLVASLNQKCRDAKPEAN